MVWDLRTQIVPLLPRDNETYESTLRAYSFIYQESRMSGWSFPGNLSNEKVVRAFSICTMSLYGYVFVGGLLSATIWPLGTHTPEDVALKLPRDAPSDAVLKFSDDASSNEKWSFSKRLDRAMGNTTENLAIDLVLTCLGLFLGGATKWFTKKINNWIYPVPCWTYI